MRQHCDHDHGEHRPETAQCPLGDSLTTHLRRQNLACRPAPAAAELVALGKVCRLAISYGGGGRQNKSSNLAVRSGAKRRCRRTQSKHTTALASPGAPLSNPLDSLPCNAQRREMLAADKDKLIATAKQTALNLVSHLISSK